MSNGIDKLKEIGAQKIYEQTHVSKEHIQAILHNSFEDLNKVQIIGFISILEREYKVDLSETKEHANDYFEQLPVDEDHNKEIFVAVREKKSNNTTLYILIIVLILAIALYFTLKNSVKIYEKIDNTLIEDVKEKIVKDENNSKIIVLPKEVNSTKESIIKVKEKKLAKVIIKEIVKEKQVVKSLKIITTSKTWIGYIDISNNKHYQKVFRNSLELNATKDWLLLFGHSQVKIEVNNQLQKHGNSIRYSYIDAKLKAITLKEFKELNKGSKW